MPTASSCMPTSFYANPPSSIAISPQRTGEWLWPHHTQWCQLRLISYSWVSTPSQHHKHLLTKPTAASTSHTWPIVPDPTTYTLSAWLCDTPLDYWVSTPRQHHKHLMKPTTASTSHMPLSHWIHPPAHDYATHTPTLPQIPCLSSLPLFAVFAMVIIDLCSYNVVSSF